jgi:hypothetical protein
MAPAGPRLRGGLVAGLVALVLSAGGLGVLGCRGLAAGGAATAPNDFAADALWDDGRAEIDAYEATVRRYGVPRSLTAYLVVVKEDFSKTQLVKADPGHDPGDLQTVLKLNHVINYQTGIYSYHQMASCFFDRGTMDLVKLSLTSNEWCGNTYKEYTRRDGRGTLHVHTYWDTQAEANYDVPTGPDVVFYDALPLWIRSLPQIAGTTRALRLLPSQIESKGPKPQTQPATLVAEKEEGIIVPAGRFRALRWELKTGGGAPDVYWTARDAPHILLAWERGDGGAYRLKWTQRLAYWTLNHPGDEAYLEGPAPAAATGSGSPQAPRSPAPSRRPRPERRSRPGAPGRPGGRFPPDGPPR